jgi:hypothetical protein
VVLDFNEGPLAPAHKKNATTGLVLVWFMKKVSSSNFGSGNQAQFWITGV